MQHELSISPLGIEGTSGEQTAYPYQAVATIGIDHAARYLESEAPLDQLFTPAELTYCDGKMASYAGRLVAKSLIEEMLGSNLPWTDIAIVRERGQRPRVVLNGEAQVRAARRGVVRIPVSLSHDGGLALAMVSKVTLDSPDIHVGSDIASVDRIARAHKRHGTQFLERIFTRAEAIEGENDATRLAQMWAAKEAIVKILGTGFWGKGVGWTDIQTLLDIDGSRRVVLSGAAGEQAHEQGLHGWRVQIHQLEQTPIALGSAQIAGR